MASAELVREFGPVDDLESLHRFDERTSILLFRSAIPAVGLLDLRLTEDAFALASDISPVPPDRSGLAFIRRSFATSSTLDPAITSALNVRPRRKGKTTFRVVARKAGDHAFRRVDLQRATELAVLDHLPSWRLVEDDAQVEVWVQLVGNRLLAGVRLSDNRMRQRGYRSVSLPAALKPTIAAAMIQLSEPRDDDVFLDPMCGSGTLLIERAFGDRYRLLLGGDSDITAVEATRANIGTKYQPIEIRQWDARRLPLDDASVSAVVCNLPFGKQVGTAQNNRVLYPALLEEWTRVLAPDGRMILLTSERALLRESLAIHPELHLERTTPVLVRGLAAYIFGVVKSPTRRSSSAMPEGNT